MATQAAVRFLRRDPVMAYLIEHAAPFKPERIERTPFEALAHAIAHQQLHGVAAMRILGRLMALHSDALPAPQWILDAPREQLRAVGFSYAKIAALKDLAANTVSGIVPGVDELAALSDAQIIERLTTVRGIGRWTVEMLLLFQLRRPDVLPVDDFGIRSGFRLAYGLRRMPKARALAQFGERWSPYRSTAAWYLWRAAELARLSPLPRFGRAPRVAMVAAAERAPKRSEKKPRPSTSAAKRSPRRAAARVRS